MRITLVSVWCTSVEDYLVQFWEGNLRRDSNDLLAQFRTWELWISVATTYFGDLSAAGVLRRIPR